MSMVLQSKLSGDFKPHPEGIYPAVCVDVIDLGYREVEYRGEKTDESNPFIGSPGSRKSTYVLFVAKPSPSTSDSAFGTMDFSQLRSGSGVTGSFAYGNVSLLLFAWTLQGLAWQASGRHALGGLAIGSAAAWKVMPLVFLPYLAWRRTLRMLLGLVLLTERNLHIRREHFIPYADVSHKFDDLRHMIDADPYNHWSTSPFQPRTNFSMAAATPSSEFDAVIKSAAARTVAFALPMATPMPAHSIIGTSASLSPSAMTSPCFVPR